MKIVGIDQSLTAMGFAAYTDGDWHTGVIRTRSMRGHERLEHLEDHFAQLIADADLIVLEGLSHGSFDSERQLAGLFWILGHRAWEENVPYATLPPANRAKWATDKGNATKDEVVAAVNTVFDFAVEDDNEADAIVLACAALQWYGHGIIELPPERHDQLTRGRWPDIEL